MVLYCAKFRNQTGSSHDWEVRNLSVPVVSICSHVVAILYVLFVVSFSSNKPLPINEKGAPEWKTIVQCSYGPTPVHGYHVSSMIA
jgi:hypothetical protein